MPKRILVLISNPKGAANLDLLPEIHDLQEALQRSQYRERFVVEWRVAKYQHDLRRHILDVRPQIVHFCGHGTTQGLVLEDEQDRAKVASNEFLTSLLKGFADWIECVVLKTLDEINDKIAALFAAHPDADFFAGLPGAGPHLAPRLLVAFGEDRTRYTQAQDLLRYTGIAPVTESSGNKCWVHWRWSCPIFLRQTFVEWADQSRQHSFWADAFYKMQRQKGKTHPMAMRALAFKWIRILFRCWQDRKPYDEAKYLLALKKKSPLVQHLAL